MSKGIFITATGTDIGKTFVTALIIKKLRQNGINAGDSEYVCKVSSMENDPKSLVSYIYETQVSPHLAAQL